jgi:hypothetical protein
VNIVGPTRQTEPVQAAYGEKGLDSWRSIGKDSRWLSGRLVEMRPDGNLTWFRDYDEPGDVIMVRSVFNATASHVALAVVQKTDQRYRVLYRERANRSFQTVVTPRKPVRVTEVSEGFIRFESGEVWFRNRARRWTKFNLGR